MTDDIARQARAAILLWELNPKRMALARLLGIAPGQVSDEMIARAGRVDRSYRNPPMQQIPRTDRRRSKPFNFGVPVLPSAAFVNAMTVLVNGLHRLSHADERENPEWVDVGGEA